MVDAVTEEAVSSVDPLVSSHGAELGVKTQWQQRWNLAAALWYLELDSELLFVGDAGTTEATRPSGRWKPWPAPPSQRKPPMAGSVHCECVTSMARR